MYTSGMKSLSLNIARIVIVLNVLVTVVAFGGLLNEVIDVYGLTFSSEQIYSTILYSAAMFMLWGTGVRAMNSIPVIASSTLTLLNTILIGMAYVQYIYGIEILLGTMLAGGVLTTLCYTVWKLTK